MMDENILYFRNILPQLKDIYLHETWNKILTMIARRIHSTCLYPSDWKDFAAEIGINDPLKLEEIEISATINKELPLYMAFCGPLQYIYTLHDVIQALISQKRVDVLCLIRKEFEDFFQERAARVLHSSVCTYSHSNCDSASIMNEDTLKPIHENTFTQKLSSDKETGTSSSELMQSSNSFNAGMCTNVNQIDNKLITEAGNRDVSGTEDSPFPQECLDFIECEKKLKDISFIKCSGKSPKKSVSCNNENMQKAEVSKLPMKISVCHHKKGLKVDLPKSPIDNKKYLNTKPSKFPLETEPISIFVPYAEEEIATGIKFANHLREAGFKVITISEAEFMIRIDRSGFLKAILRKVDFVVPVLSERYILYVRPKYNSPKLNNNDATTNRFIFTWIHSEFENNYCFNVRVKPVIVEGFNKKLIKDEPIFQWVHQLWDEVNLLVKILHETKQMMKDFMTLWDQEKFVEQWMNYLNQN